MERLRPLRTVLESDSTALGARAGTFSHSIIEVYGDLGLDYAWLDFEHGGPSVYDTHEMAHFVRAAATAGLDLLTRLPVGDPPLVRRVLDSGVRTILIPRVESVDDVEPAVAASRFHWDGGVGDRGVGGERSSGWAQYPDQYTKREDDTVLVGAMVENKSAVDNLDEILDVPEIGFLFIGPADLSVSLGHPLELDHPTVEESIETVRTAARDAGVPVGRIVSDREDAIGAIDDGYDILRIGGEVAAARAVIGPRLTAIQEYLG